jgi:hypothetical protein
MRDADGKLLVIGSLVKYESAGSGWMCGKIYESSGYGARLKIKSSISNNGFVIHVNFESLYRVDEDEELLLRLQGKI